MATANGITTDVVVNEDNMETSEDILTEVESSEAKAADMYFSEAKAADVYFSEDKVTDVGLSEDKVTDVELSEKDKVTDVELSENDKVTDMEISENSKVTDVELSEKDKVTDAEPSEKDKVTESAATDDILRPRTHPSFPGFEQFKRSLEREIYKSMYPEFLVISGILTADLFKVQIKEAITSSIQYHIYYKAAESVKLELQYGSEEEASKIKDKINKSKLPAVVENATDESVFFSVKAYKQPVEIPTYAREQVLVAFGLSDAMFNDDNHTLADTFTGFKTILYEKYKRWAFMIYETGYEATMVLASVIRNKPMCEADWPMRVGRLATYIGHATFDFRQPGLRNTDIDVIKKALAEIEKIEGDLSEEKQKEKDSLSAKMEINKHFVLLRQEHFAQLKKKKQDLAAKASISTDRAVGGRVTKVTRGSRRGAMHGVPRGGGHGVNFRGERGMSRGEMGMSHSERGMSHGARGRSHGARGGDRAAPYHPVGAPVMLPHGARKAEARQAERTLDLLLDISTALHNHGHTMGRGPPMSDYARNRASPMGLNPYGQGGFPRRDGPRGRMGRVQGRRGV